MINSMKFPVANNPFSVNPMNLSTLRKICCLTFLVCVGGCSGTTTSRSEETVNFSEKQVISGAVSGYAPKTLASVSDSSGNLPAYHSTTGQFIFTNFASATPNNGHEFSATFSDDSRLYSFWEGTETDAARIILIRHDSPANLYDSVSVETREPSAFVNINPATNLAYWLWKSDDKHPFNNHYHTVFYFLQAHFSDYNLPLQDLIMDNPSLELQQLFDDFSINASDSSGYTIIRKSDGQLHCRGEFIAFEFCR